MKTSIFSPLSKQEKALVAVYSLLNVLLLEALESLMLASTLHRDILTRGAAGMIDIAAVALSIVVTSPLPGLFLIRHPHFARHQGSAAPTGKRLRLIILSLTVFGVVCGLLARAWQGPVVTYPHIGVATLCFFLYGCGTAAMTRSRLLGR